MITYLYYSYRGDQEILICSIKILRKQTSDRIVIVDDGFNPMDPNHYQLLKDLQCEIHISSHNRNGNLIGTEHTLYHAKKMLELSPTDNDIVVKADPDTIIFDNKFIQTFIENKESVLFGGFKNHINYIIGMCYIVKGGESLIKYVEDVENYPSWLRCFEDFEVSSRYYRLTEKDPHKITRINLLSNNGWCLCDYKQFKPEMFTGISVWNGGFLSNKDIKNKEAQIKFYRNISEAYCKYDKK